MAHQRARWGAKPPRRSPRVRSAVCLEQKVIDQSRRPEECCHSYQRPAANLFDRLECVRMNHIEVVELCRPLFNEYLPACGAEFRGIALSLLEYLVDLLQRSMQYARGLALLLIEIHVAGTHCQAVRFANNLAGDDLNRNV